MEKELGRPGEEGSVDRDPIKVDIRWDPDPMKVDYNKIWLERFLPSLAGSAAKLDRFLRCKGSRMKATVVSSKIKFERPDNEDPDFLVRRLHSMYLPHEPRKPIPLGTSLYPCRSKCAPPSSSPPPCKSSAALLGSGSKASRRG